MNDTKLKGIAASAKAFAATLDDSAALASRTNIVRQALATNHVGEKGGSSQNATLEALSAAIAPLVPMHVKGYGASNLGHYARVARTLDALSVTDTPTVVSAVYNATLLDGKAVKALADEISADKTLTTMPQRRDALTRGSENITKSAQADKVKAAQDKAVAAAAQSATREGDALTDVTGETVESAPQSVAAFLQSVKDYMTANAETFTDEDTLAIAETFTAIVETLTAPVE